MKIGYLENSLTNSHYKKFFDLISGPLAGEGAKIVAANELVPSDEGKKWAADKGVTYMNTAEEVVEACDAIIVLGPNNPELHLELARPALVSGKPTFIDKMLASTVADAKEILKIAADNNTPVMSASGLRFAVELEELESRVKGPIDAVFVRGYGKFPVYAIHTITLAMRYFEGTLQRVIDTGGGQDRVITLDGDKMRASIEVRESKNQTQVSPWQVGLRSNDNYELTTIKDADGFYTNVMRQAIQLFKTGKSPMSHQEQLNNIVVQEAAEESVSKGNTWIEVG